MPPSTAAAHVSARRRPTLDGIDWLAIEDALNDAGSARDETHAILTRVRAVLLG